KDIFKNLMWYSFKDSNKQYPLTIERVRQIQQLNKSGKKADELQAVELDATYSKNAVKTEMGFVNDVGQISLKTLEGKNSRSTQKRNKGNRPKQQAHQPHSNKPNHNPKNKPPKNRRPSKDNVPNNPPRSKK